MKAEFKEFARRIQGVCTHNSPRIQPSNSSDLFSPEEIGTLGYIDKKKDVPILTHPL